MFGMVWLAAAILLWLAMVSGRHNLPSPRATGVDARLGAGNESGEYRRMTEVQFASNLTRPAPPQLA
jgi:hypothetical protein